MSADRLNDVLVDTMRAVAREAVDELLPGVVARQLHTVEQVETDQTRELRRICAQEYLTKREAALFLNVSESHIDNLISDDATFPVHKVGNKNVRFRRVELIEWTREQGRRRLRAAS